MQVRWIGIWWNNEYSVLIDELIPTWKEDFS